MVRCHGRIVSGEEAQLLQREIEKQTQITKNVVLHLGQIEYVDSGGLGALIRMRGVLQAARGDLKLCELSPFVTQVLQATNLVSVFRPCASEKEAVEAFSARQPVSERDFQVKNNRIICLDASQDVLAYVKLLLTRSGYQVFTTQYPSDAVALVGGAKSSVVILGPSMRSNESALARLRQSAPNAEVLHLPADFSTSEADQMGAELVGRVRSLLAPEQS